MENETALAYAEVDAILELLEDEYVNRVPIYIREYFKDEKDKEYHPKININETLNIQNLKRKTMVLLAILNLNYWCDSEEEKLEFLKELNNNENIKIKEEQELREKYNSDNIFKKKNDTPENEESTAIIEYKEQNFIKKIIEKIMRIFKRG